jgi:hypothetical protein
MTSRRNFLGAMAAVPIAAPKLAQGLMDSVQGMPATAPNSYPSTIGYATDTPPQPDPSFWLRRIKEITEDKARIEREADEFKADDDVSHVAVHYDALRSIAAAPKRLMFARRRKLLEAKQRLSWLDNDIVSIKKNLGLLGKVLG